MTQYAERDIVKMDEEGGYYFRHVSAMTGEKLHDKSSIAAELGYRDMRIAELEEKARSEYFRGINDAARYIRIQEGGPFSPDIMAVAILAQVKHGKYFKQEIDNADV